MIKVPLHVRSSISLLDSVIGSQTIFPPKNRANKIPLLTYFPPFVLLFIQSSLPSLLPQILLICEYTNIYLQNIKYRERWGVDKIDEWTVPQTLQDYIVHGLSGFDKDGAPCKFKCLPSASLRPP